MKTVSFPFGAELRIVPISARFSGSPNYVVQALKRGWLWNRWVPVCVCDHRDEAEAVVWHMEQDANA